MKLDLSELARVITGAIVNEYVSRGYVDTSETAPEVGANAAPDVGANAAPDASATVRGARRTPNARAGRATSKLDETMRELGYTQTAPVAVPLPTPTLLQTAVLPTGQNVSISSTVREAFTAHAPEGICAKIGGERDPRIKLPKALFAEFSTVVLEFPNGARVAVSEDTEGRAKFPRKDALAYTGAREGQYLKFDETNAGYFAVSVKNAVLRPTSGASSRKSETGEQAAQRIYDGKFAGLFTDTGAAQTSTEKPKRAASPAQLKAREDFATKKRAIRCAGCESRVKIGDTVETEKGRMCPACMTQFERAFEATYGRKPLYAQGTRKGRKAPAHNVGAAQMVYAGVPAPVAVPLTNAAFHVGIVDNAGRAARMRENLAARTGQTAPVAVPLPKR